MTKDKSKEVSVASVPTQLIKDILQCYRENQGILKGQNTNDYSAIMKKIASEWEKDRAYDGFDVARITGPFSSKMINVQRARFRKILNKKQLGSGFEAAVTKHDCWMEAHATFSKESGHHQLLVSHHLKYMNLIWLFHLLLEVKLKKMQIWKRKNCWKRSS